MHCDTILECYLQNKSLKNLSGHINADKLRKGETLAQCFALFMASHAAAESRGIGAIPPWEIYKNLLACYKENIAACSDSIRCALCPEDILINAQEGFISSILTVEDCIGVEGRPERIQEMYSDGVRMAALTWNYENCIGFPNSADEEAHTKKGLKPFGFEAVELMNELGIIVDVSHLSEKGFYDVAEHSTKPFAASHSCARALCSHQRNLTDAQLRKIGETGSVVGVNFYAKFLKDGGKHTEIADIIAHMKRIVNCAGEESLALGSDFDGINCTLEFEDCAGMPKLLAAMEKEFSDDEIDRICSENFLRVFSEQ